MGDLDHLLSVNWEEYLVLTVSEVLDFLNLLCPEFNIWWKPPCSYFLLHSQVMKQTKVSKFCGLPLSLYYSTQGRKGGQDSNWEGIVQGLVKRSEQNSKLGPQEIKTQTQFPINLSSSDPTYSLQQSTSWLNLNIKICINLWGAFRSR